ncbi:uncharacterized protein TrAtP1_002541 [Trichoderma atroviride]|uniref:uncharacterized protein n=1 Tax=Hypocrea atroviridis TaxID=63577 RepID=UPI00331C91E5|nr:hypothetical protein TrAtP1_002541 [Trichoderma atroviride]
MSTPTLKHVFTMAITPKAPVNVGETPRGKANWFEITGGTITGVDGTHIADVNAGGGDYLTRFVDDNVAEVDLRLIAKDSNGELLRLTVSGFDYLDRATMLALDGRAGEDPGNNTTGITEPYGFEIVKCSTASQEYRWMNFAVLIARVSFIMGAAGIESVEYKVFHVTN